MQEVVGISFRQATKTYYFSPIDEDVLVGDEVVVETANGQAVGVVTKAKFQVEDSEIEPPLRPVIRKVTAEDKEKLEKLKKKAEDNLPVIVEKIEKLNLPMKVIEVQYSFDGTKVTISYTSEDRVDFRELLKVLASALKTKIELRQIGIRDEVKAVGALGLCGRPCCCTTFLQQGEHVVVKMAKTQNMSLSPSKTGGACGKMMCCLAYEEPVYRELLAKMPKVGSTIETPEGKGVVHANDIIRGTITVKVYSDDDSFKFVDYRCSELGIDLYGDETVPQSCCTKNGCSSCGNTNQSCEKCKTEVTKTETNETEKSEFKNFTQAEKTEIINKFNEAKSTNKPENLQTQTKKVDFNETNVYNKKDEREDSSSKNNFRKNKKDRRNRHNNFHRNFKPKKGENL